MSLRARVLLTGAFGFLGLALTRRLARRFEVTALGHPPRVNEARKAIPAEVACVEGELEQAIELLRTERFDAVCHLAGGGGPAKCVADPIAAVRVNVTATTDLARAARAAAVPRFLFASTVAVFGSTRDLGRPYDESDEPRPDDLYGAVKLAAERAVAGCTGGTSIRLPNLYGAGAGVDLGIQGAVERFARAAASGAKLTTFGGGKQRIDYLHVDDAARAFELALDAPTLPEALHVGGGQPIAIGDLAARCVEAARRMGAEPTIVDEPAPQGKSWPDRSLSNALAKKQIAWAPSVSYETGLVELVAMMAAGSKPQEPPTRST
jgi:nucleoside-diphosphate-sugar epimerase